MSESGQTRDIATWLPDVRFTRDCVAKLVRVRLQSLVVSFNQAPCLRSPLFRLRCPFLGAYAGQVAARGGGARQRSLASRLRFCAVAVSRTSSLMPLKPRSRNR